MSQEKKDSPPLGAGQANPFDDKTVVRPRSGFSPQSDSPSPASAPPLTASDEAPARRSSLDEKFEERTAIAPRQSKAQPKPAPQPEPEPQEETTPVRDALSIKRPKTAPKTPPKQISRAAPKTRKPQRQESWDIRQEVTDPGTYSGVNPDILATADRNRNIVRGLAVFAVTMVLALIVRKFINRSSGSHDASTETTMATKVEGSRAPTSNSADASADGGTMDELMRQFDQAFVNSQSQIR